MLPKHIINTFLQKELNNWDWIKELPKSELEKEIKELFPTLPIKNPLFQHQLVCFLIGHYNNSFLYFVDMGLGKTAIILAILAYKKQERKFKKALILVPYEVSMEGWEREVNKHSYLSILKLTGKTSKEKLEQLQNCKEDLVVVPYPSFTSMFSNKEGRKWRPNIILIREVLSIFDTLVLDESHSVKSSTSLIFSILEKVSKMCKYRYGLTGTPFGRDAQDFWAQFYLIDRGETLGDSIFVFREAFFNAKMNRWRGVDYTLNSKLENRLHEKMKNKSIRYSEEEVNDLPEKTNIKITLDLSDDAKTYYNKVLQDALDIGGNVEKIGNTFYVMRCITSGYLCCNNPIGEKEHIVFSFNPKIFYLQEFMLTSAAEKVVIYYEYTYSGDLICEKLNELKILHVRLYSGTKDKQQTIKEFLDNPKCKVLVVNSKSGALGLNLQDVCKYQIFYESPVSPIIRKQAEKRCHRTGQKHHVFIYDLVVKKSIDEKILFYLAQGEDLFQKLLKDSKLLL